MGDNCTKKNFLLPPLQMWGSSTLGTAKFCDPLFISTATEASNLKFVIQLVFGE